MKLNENGKIGDKYKCPHCDFITSKKGICTHIGRNHGDGINHKHSRKYKDNEFAGNKGLTADTSEIVKKYTSTIKKKYENGEIIPSFLGKTHSAETRKKLSQSLSLNNKGGRCKGYEVKNPNGIEFKVQGTGELKITEYLSSIDPSGIKLSINNKEHSLKGIDDENKLHTYTPDFYSPKYNKYFEVKGFGGNNDKIKMEKVIEQNKNIEIEIIQKDKLF